LKKTRKTDYQVFTLRLGNYSGQNFNKICSLLDDDSPDEDNDNVRIKFAGIKTGKKPEMSGNGQIDDEEEEEHGWEEQQVMVFSQNKHDVDTV
jgi:hypothetical protein